MEIKQIKSCEDQTIMLILPIGHTGMKSIFLRRTYGGESNHQDRAAACCTEVLQ